ncbi:MAG: PadR family transcriptional regulator [Candidatus Bathyarchaeota archaeon]|nr:PadR family transcriptional regulator [Candidatus Bathyarchaeum tardum]WGM89031.1 MAG: PadR family transcriptional regulator [Candidatus Bathyarchaeum tardum]
MYAQSVKAILDWIILSELKNRAMSGYDIISYIHNKFGILLSSGTVYSHLYSLERKNLIMGDYDERKRIYKISSFGKKSFDEISKSNLDLLKIIEKV